MAARRPGWGGQVGVHRRFRWQLKRKKKENRARRPGGFEEMKMILWSNESFRIGYKYIDLDKRDGDISESKLHFDLAIR